MGRERLETHVEPGGVGIQAPPLDDYRARVWGENLRHLPDRCSFRGSELLRRVDLVTENEIGSRERRAIVPGEIWTQLVSGLHRAVRVDLPGVRVELWQRFGLVG